MLDRRLKGWDDLRWARRSTSSSKRHGTSPKLDSHTVFSIGGWDISQHAVHVLHFGVGADGRSDRRPQASAGPEEQVPEHRRVWLRLREHEHRIADVIGEGFKKHIPFLCTLFFFILIANVVGLIPGAKATTGTISITWALAAISFVYFNFYGLKTLGVFGYIKSLVPSGVPGPMVPIIWFLEFFSMVIRVLTLAVRLYGNMLAGHMVLAVFSFGNHRVPAAGCFQHGFRCRAASLGRMVRFAGPCACRGVPGGVPSGVRVHHPVRFLHRHGGSSPLMRGPAVDPPPVLFV